MTRIFVLLDAVGGARGAGARPGAPHCGFIYATNQRGRNRHRARQLREKKPERRISTGSALKGKRAMRVRMRPSGIGPVPRSVDVSGPVLPRKNLADTSPVTRWHHARSNREQNKMRIAQHTITGHIEQDTAH
jgi:hypothetical protein